MALPHPVEPRATAEAAAVCDAEPPTQRFLLHPSPSAETLGALRATPMETGEAFAFALSLLQNDVAHLCLAAGVDLAEMWPAEALLCNLALLEAFADRRYREIAATVGGRGVVRRWGTGGEI